MISQTWFTTSLVIVCALVLHISLLTKVKSYIVADKISKLPGQPNVNFQQYSGYITVDEKQERSYFYYFVEAETDIPDSKPLVLWLNGGPGCSSLGYGAFGEHGPFRPTAQEGILVRNYYSWNKVANMLYLESPAGVGFSYSTNKSFYNYVNDYMTAEDNFNFLKKWLLKYPEFKNTKFFITGESYAGHFVPQLANLIIHSKPKLLNLAGVAIGNPLLDFNTDFNSVSEYWWSHGLISDSTFHDLTFVCNFSEFRRQSQIIGPITRNCKKVIDKVNSDIGDFVDYYDVTLDVCSSSVSQQSHQVLNQMQNEPKIDVCNDEETYAYLNRKDVMLALHARILGVEKWFHCTDDVKYDMRDWEMPTKGILGKIVKSGVRVLIYSGDQDSVIPLIGTRKLINELAKELNLKTTREYSTWIVVNQAAGWTQEYGKLLSYATIRGASHDAPFTQPERSLVLFNSFLNGMSLPSPPPVNKTMNSSNEKKKKIRNTLIRLI
ncbi:hypothetical protein CASFOL_021809 [Castilleja foliolosa]|uniref:Carboxypeptidase n=1 Tax=Castilleja foliolosa TaxID=1961234 RepID=A0ABD3CXM9_9LAMI